MKAVYICEDYQIEDGTLFIWGSKLIGMVNDNSGFNTLYDEYIKVNGSMPNGIVCPDIYCKERGINICVFKD